MANLDQIIDKLNAFLQRQGLPKIAGAPSDAASLYGAVLRSVWQHPDKKAREDLAFGVAAELKKYFGGKILEDVYARVKRELDEAEAKTSAQTAARAEADKKKDPNYVPPFDELFKN